MFNDLRNKMHDTILLFVIEGGGEEEEEKVCFALSSQGEVTCPDLMMDSTTMRNKFGRLMTSSIQIFYVTYWHLW